jgi:acyl carrier protein phosphodiesterase
MRTEEVEKLFEKEKQRKARIKKLAVELDRFLSAHKKQWFTAEELAKALNAPFNEVLDAFYELRWRTLNFLLGRFETKTFEHWTTIYRKRW